MNCTKKSIIRILGALLFIGTIVSDAREMSEPNRDEREINMAESALFWARVATVSAYGRSACESNQLACSDDRADMGLALIGEKQTAASLNALVRIARYRMDGALSENYVCYLLSKGNAITSKLISFNSKNAERECRMEFDDKRKGNQRLFEGVSSNQICNSSKAISYFMNELIVSLKSGKKCSDSDF